MAILKSSRFDGADLRKAVFFMNRLRGVNFRGANVSRTGFSMCQLQGADFSDATLKGTKFINGTEVDEKTTFPPSFKLSAEKYMDWKGKGPNPTGSE